MIIFAYILASLWFAWCFMTPLYMTYEAIRDRDWNKAFDYFCVIWPVFCLIGAFPWFVVVLAEGVVI